MDFEFVADLSRIYNQPFYKEMLSAIKVADIKAIDKILVNHPEVLYYETTKGNNWLFIIIDQLNEDDINESHVALFQYFHQKKLSLEDIYKHNEKPNVVSFFLEHINNDSNIEVKKSLWSYLLTQELNLYQCDSNGYNIVQILWRLSPEVFNWAEPMMREAREEYESVIYAQYDVPFFVSVLQAFKNRGLFPLFVKRYPKLIDMHYSHYGHNLAFMAANNYIIDVNFPFVVDMLKATGLESMIYELKTKDKMIDDIIFFIYIHMNMIPKEDLPPLFEYIEKNIKDIKERLLIKRDSKYENMYQYIMKRAPANKKEVQAFFIKIAQSE